MEPPGKPGISDPEPCPFNFVLSAVQAELQKLIQRWRKDADQYAAQVEEARRAGTPYDQMLSGATFLRQCAKELEAISQSKKVEEGPHAAQRK